MRKLASRLIQIGWRNTFIMTSRIKFFDVIVFLFLNLDSAPKFMSILLLSLELRQFSGNWEFVQEIEKTLVWILSNIRGLERVKDTKFGIIVSNWLLQSIQSEVTNSQIDPKNMQDKFSCSVLHFYLLNGFNGFWKLHEI